MNKPTDMGRNRTGAAVHPLETKKLEQAERGVRIDPGRDATGLHRARTSYAVEAPPVGTMPPPANIKGTARALAGALQGEKITVLLDLIGERLAYERSGVRLYEALMVKLPGADMHPGRPTMEALVHLRDQELEHFHLLCRAAERLGGDPTAMTPAADVTAVASAGVIQVLTDPRTTLNQCLKTMLGVELTDVASWELLIQLAEALDQDEIAAEFREAAVHEEQHLIQVRSWVQTSVAGDAGVEKEMAEHAPAPPPGA